MRSHIEHPVSQKLKINKAITEINLLKSILFEGKTVGTKQDCMDVFDDAVATKV
jgi:type I restriction enzyme R subunit